MAMDWTGCNEVERGPGKVGGAPILKGTRVQADLVVDIFKSGLSTREIAETYTLRPGQIQAVVDYAILVNIYRNAEYRVAGDCPFTIHIGQPSAALSQLMAFAGVSSAALITAENPFSRLRTVEQNRVATESLLDSLQKRCDHIVVATGTDPSEGWPSEKSFLALGLSREDARALAVVFGQNAIVWVEEDAIPQLIMFGMETDGMERPRGVDR